MTTLSLETRKSDSAWISTVWTCESRAVTAMTAVASETLGVAFWEHEGTWRAAITGPERRTSVAPVPTGATFVGIQFAVGTSLRVMDSTWLVDRGVELPDVSGRSFLLDGQRLEIPGPDDAEALVRRLVRRAVLVRDPVVAELARGGKPTVSQRTIERRFRAATGLTRGAVAQIDRVRHAAALLLTGAETADVVEQLGYYDEPHLARMLRRYVGRTARQLRGGSGGAIALDPGQYTTS